MREPINRELPPYRDDPLIAGLTDEQVDRLADLIVRFAYSWAERHGADAHDDEEAVAV